MFHYGYLVQGIGVTAYFRLLWTNLDKIALLDAVSAVVQVVYGLLYLVARNGGEEAQTSGIYTQNGVCFISHSCGSAKQCAIATVAYYNIGCEIIVADDFVVYIYVGIVLFQKSMESMVYDIRISSFCQGNK